MLLGVVVGSLLRRATTPYNTGKRRRRWFAGVVDADGGAFSYFFWGGPSMPSIFLMYADKGNQPSEGPERRLAVHRGLEIEVLYRQSDLIGPWLANKACKKTFFAGDCIDLPPPITTTDHHPYPYQPASASLPCLNIATHPCADTVSQVILLFFPFWLKCP